MMPTPLSAAEADSAIRSILSRAATIANSAEASDERTYARAHIAHVMRRLGLEPEFGSYVDEAIAANEALLQERHPWFRDPERQAAIDKLAALDRTAKERFLSGDLRGAEEIYLSAEDLRDDHERAGIPGAHATFLRWMLEGGDLPGAVRFFNSVDQSWPGARIFWGAEIAAAFIKEGHRSAGLDFLRGLRPASDAPYVLETLSLLGTELWRAGEQEEAIDLIRQAARRSLVVARQRVGFPLSGLSGWEPIALAQIQCGMGDHAGATVTLDAVLQFAVPLELDPPPPRPAGLPPSALFIAGHTLKPASARWLAALPDLIRVLAQADRDDTALSLARSVPMKQLEFLGEVVRGQARRGAFSGAFDTLVGIETAELVAANEPSRISFKPDGSVGVFTQTSPIRPVEPLERSAARRRGLQFILNYATTAGEVGAFEHADRLLRELPPTDPHFGEKYQYLHLRVHRGEIDMAFELLDRISEPRHRLGALRSIVDCAAKVYRPRRVDFSWHA